jgi:hypothetical protein
VTFGFFFLGCGSSSSSTRVGGSEAEKDDAEDDDDDDDDDDDEDDVERAMRRSRAALANAVCEGWRQRMWLAKEPWFEKRSVHDVHGTWRSL